MADNGYEMRRILLERILLIFVALGVTQVAGAQLADEVLPIAPQRYDDLSDVPSRVFGPPRKELSREALWQEKGKKTNRSVAGVSSGEKILRAKVGPKRIRKSR